MTAPLIWITALFCFFLAPNVAMAGHKKVTTKRVTKTRTIKRGGKKVTTRTTRRGHEVHRRTTVRHSPHRSTRVIKRRRVQTRPVVIHHRPQRRAHHHRVYRTQPVVRVTNRGNVRVTSTCYWYGTHQHCDVTTERIRPVVRRTRVYHRPVPRIRVRF